MTFIVMDHDRMPGGDDLIGLVEIPVEPIFKKPGVWVDEIYQLQNKKVKNVSNFGEIYL
jgi:hypothetical protein